MATITSSNPVTSPPALSPVVAHDKIVASQEATRAKIALVFTQIFLLLITISLVMPTILSISFPQIVKDPVEATKTILTVVASILAGPFGFIVGFYFKQETTN